MAQRATIVEVLRILISTGPTGTMHFQTWPDKAEQRAAFDRCESNHIAESLICEWYHQTSELASEVPHICCTNPNESPRLIFGLSGDEVRSRGRR